MKRIALVLALVACGGSAKTPPSTSGGVVVPPVTVTQKIDSTSTLILSNGDSCKVRPATYSTIAVGETFSCASQPPVGSGGTTGPKPEAQ